MKSSIQIKGAKIHNLKSVDVTIPKNKLTVITGVSGSGKSSLAFDTLYEEGKRRYLLFSGTDFMVNSEATFDEISGLSPTVAVEQRIIRQSNPRSTVGTKTKITNMLAILFATCARREAEYDDGVPLAMEMFLKNSPKGMCVKCLGKGFVKTLDEEKLFSDKSQRIIDVCVGVGKRGTTRKLLDNFCKVHSLDINQTLESLTEVQLINLLYGDNGESKFMGFVPWIFEITNGLYATSGRLEYLLKEAGYMTDEVCSKCGGSGLSEYATHSRIAGNSINELESLYISDLYDALLPLKTELDAPLLDEILVKLECMIDVGLHHLSLSRPVPTLSGGEIQRLFLASYIIAEMDSIIFIFDEPTIGLHEVEKEKLINIIKRLIDRGNTVVAVEHDLNFIKSADYIVDLGPYAGVHGGIKIFEGGYRELLACNESKTAPYLKDINCDKTSYRTIDKTKMLRIENANIHNLNNVSIDIPLGMIVGVAGVSGSGKSSLISDTLVPKLNVLLKSNRKVDDIHVMDEHANVTGYENINKCIVIDQKPIGRSVTSCLATYTGMMDVIRKMFAATDEAVEKGYDASLFSLNSKGACKMCKGEGIKKYHVGYGNFVEVMCDACDGMGYVKEALLVKINGKSIIDIMSMSVDEAAVFFKGINRTLDKKLSVLQSVGMGYICLGQKTPTISGGESQRIKLATELAKMTKSGGNLYIMDEPTTGLSMHDSIRLMELIENLVERGNSVIITEHDPYMLENCDYIIEMGVGGGTDGGDVIAFGTPHELKNNSDSIIGRYLG